MSELKGLCQNCLRYNPTGQSNCVMARGASSLMRKFKFALLVTDCESWLQPKEEKVVEEEAEENGAGVAVTAVLENGEEEEE